MRITLLIKKIISHTFAIYLGHRMLSVATKSAKFDFVRKYFNHNVREVNKSYRIDRERDLKIIYILNIKIKWIHIGIDPTQD